MAMKHLKRCSTTLVIREMQIKTTMRYHFTSNKMSIIKKPWNIVSVDEDVVKWEP